MSEGSTVLTVAVLGSGQADGSRLLGSLGARAGDRWEVLAVGADPEDTATTTAAHGATLDDAMARAPGEYLAIAYHDDQLAPGALDHFVAAIAENPGVDIVYCDEDQIHRDGTRHAPWCKPLYSPDELRNHDILGRLTAYRTELLREIGGYPTEAEGAEEHDLALRAAERTRSVVHLPRILYHRGSDPMAAAAASTDAHVRVVQRALDRQSIPARAVPHPSARDVVRLEPVLVDHPTVTIVIPTAGATREVRGEPVRLVDQCLRSIQTHTVYPCADVVVVVDRSADPSLDEVLADPDAPLPVRTIRNHRAFNFSEACNAGRDHASGETLVFLNDDTEVIESDWLERLVLFTGLDGVGAVGAKLLFGDGRLQHVGMVSRHGLGHRGMGLAGDLPGPFRSYVVQSNVLSVTGACLAVRADRFDEVGGFAAAFPLACNDVDLCLKLQRAGYRTVLDGDTRLVHHESATRDAFIPDEEIERLFRRWRPYLEDDPFDNPQLRIPGSGVVEQDPPPMHLLQARELADHGPPATRRWPVDYG